MTESRMIESRMIEVPAGIDAGTQIPVTTITGARPGPVLALVAGNHGYEYPPVLALQKPVYLDPAEVLASPETGILYWHVERDQTVAKGALLAHITDFFGNRIAEVHSPLDGVVLYVVATPPIAKGQPVACIAARGTLS